MKLLIGIILIFGGITISSAQIKDSVHTPKKNSPERQAILDALRTAEFPRFQVNFMRLHNGWAWIDVTPLDQSGKPVAEGGPQLLHYENGKWSVMDLSKVPEDPQDPLGPQDASAGFVRNLRKTFRGVPPDIFPKPSH